MTPILTITGSDNSGFSGLQKDIRVISEMAGHAMTVATGQVTQNERFVKNIEHFSEQQVRYQIENIMSDFHPRAVKVGMIGSPEVAWAVSKEIVGCKRIVVSPGILFTNGVQNAHEHTIKAIMRYLVPMATLLILRCREAEIILGKAISNDKDMQRAANIFLEMGAQNVLLRGGHIANGRVTAVLASSPGLSNEDVSYKFFSSYFVEGWEQHGVGSALSAAITTRLGMGDDVSTAIRNAHEYVHSRVVYALSEDEQRLRPADIYNEFMNLIADNYTKMHDVLSYAEKLNVSTRYLAMITTQTVSKSPKQVISDYLIEKARLLLMNSRLSVKEVAVELGFRTESIFCTFFKQQVGATPNSFRKSAQSFS